MTSWASRASRTGRFAADIGCGTRRRRSRAPTSLRLIAPPERPYGVQKQIDITLEPAGSKVTLVHRIQNVGSWPIELAPWALTVMAPGGQAIIPLPDKVPHTESLLPNQVLVLWSYTDLNGTKYITLKQDPKRPATKIGIRHDAGWVGYLRSGLLFVKRFGKSEGKHYPDFGANFETFTNEDMLEVESLGPMTRLEPAEHVEHRETWELHQNVPPVRDEADIDRAVLPLVGKK
jgi:hypothetical protein